MLRGRCLGVLLAFSSMLTSLASAATLDRALGLRPPTAEEQTRFLAASVAVTDLEPNELALVRYHEEAETARLLGKALATPVGLPGTVDNSTLPYFPPIRGQGSQNSCAAWASCYYYSTFTQAKDEGYIVAGGDNTTICSPGFMYNLINGGADAGSSLDDAMLRLSEIGCSSWADKPYSSSDYTSWPSETAWVNALRNRTSTPHHVDAGTAAGLDTVKQHLANGNLAIFGMLVYQTFYDSYPSDGIGISNGVYYAQDGEQVGGHAITLVGYDDSKSYVDHRDGETHYGAFLIANSWGSGWGVENSTGAGTKGFFWVAYSAFLDGTIWYYGDRNVYYSDDRLHYRPSCYAVVGVDHAQRNQVSLNCSIGSGPAWVSHNTINGDGGAYPVSDTDCLAVDMTDGAAYLGTPPALVAARLSVAFAAGSSGTITRADCYEDLDGNGSYAVHSSTDPAVTVLPGSVGIAALWLVPSPGQDCDITSTTIPAALEWDEVTASTVTVTNLGPAEWLTGDGYELLVQGTVDRWGIANLPLSEDVPAGDSHVFGLGLTAPPVTTLAYSPPVTDTGPGVLRALPVGLAMARDAVALTGGLFDTEIAISRFADIQPGTAGAWARFYVEECAGRVPSVVSGYGDGTYRPSTDVTRDQMAVFMQRALRLPLVTYTGDFTDVPVGFWAGDQIQTLKEAEIVGGYGDGTYRPSDIVARDAMTVFVARGLAGGDGSVPAGPGTATFSDVPTDYWAYKYVEYAVANGVVGGYGDGTYRPRNAVTRDQMAVFVYRAFVQSGGVVVVLAGPAVTAVDPATGGQCGWASTDSGPATDPGFAYVAFDALRLDPGLALGGAWDIRLELRLASSPETPAAGSYAATVSLTEGDLIALRDAAKVSGEAYYVAGWDIPGGLTPGDYLLIVSAEDHTGVVHELPRRSALAILP